MENNFSPNASLAEEMATQLKQFRTGSFGIGRLRGDKRLLLFACGQIYPITFFRILLRDEHAPSDPPIIADQDSFNYQLILDDLGTGKSPARLALIQEGKRAVITLPDEFTPLSGFVTLVAQTHSPDQPQLAIDTTFAADEQGKQASSIVWDAAPELIRHWQIRASISESEVSSNYGEF